MGNSIYDRNKLNYKYYNLKKRESLNLSYENIKEIDYYVFNGLSNVKLINLSNNELELLGSIFHGLNNLIEIDLQSNQLKELDSKCFRDLPKLECIKLQDNQLKTLHSDQFLGLTKLKIVYLNNNQIYELGSSLFKDCHSLVNVQLQNNQLKSIDPYMFQGLKNLKNLAMYKNNWTTNRLELSLDDCVLGKIEVSFKSFKSNDIDFVFDPNRGYSVLCKKQFYLFRLKEIGLYNDKYKKIKLVVIGQLSSVYVVEDIFYKKKYALKSIQNGLHAYTLETKILKDLDSPYVLKFVDSFSHRDLKCIVTEYCEGGDLGKRLRQHKKNNSILEKQILKTWSIEIIKAISYIHSRNIIHRDIKPENIFLTLNDNLKLGDFGVSMNCDASDTETSFSFVGTVFYMSPEIFGKKRYDYKTDVWSTGCVIYEMITFNKLESKFQFKIDELINNTNAGLFLRMLLRKMLDVDQTKRLCSKELENLVENYNTA